MGDVAALQLNEALLGHSGSSVLEQHCKGVEVVGQPSLFCGQLRLQARTARRALPRQAA